MHTHNKLNHLRLHFIIFALKQQTQGFVIKLISNIGSISIIYKYIKCRSSHQCMIRSQQYSTIAYQVLSYSLYNMDLKNK